MKLIQRSLYILSIFTITVATAQEAAVQQGPKTIDQQFTETIEESNNYKQFKVIEKTKMNRLQANTKKRITGLQEEIKTLENKISEQEAAALKVSTDLETTQQNLDATNLEKDSINLFGTQMKKGTYQTTMFSIIGVLLLGLLLFIYKFKNSNTLTKEAQYKLNETESEFEDYRRKALEKEQKLGRQLQDERNKALKAGKN